MTTDFNLKLQRFSILFKTFDASLKELDLVVKVANAAISELSTALILEPDDAESGV